MTEASEIRRKEIHHTLGQFVGEGINVDKTEIAAEGVPEAKEVYLRMGQSSMFEHVAQWSKEPQHTGMYSYLTGQGDWTIQSARIVDADQHSLQITTLSEKTFIFKRSNKQEK